MMTPEERTCGNCAAYIFEQCRVRGAAPTPTSGGPLSYGCSAQDTGCPDHRSAAEQVAQWEARAAEARFTMHDFARIQDHAETTGRVEERKATVAWLRDTERCTESARGLR